MKNIYIVFSFILITHTKTNKNDHVPFFSPAGSDGVAFL